MSKQRVTATPEAITAANKTINAFFIGKPLNSKRIAWFNPDDEKLPEGVISEFTKSIQVFFKERKWYNGGPVPYELLYTSEFFHLINNVALLDAVEMAYKGIDRQKAMAQTVYKKNIDIAITLGILHECESKNIPQDHIGGLLLMYLILCERVVPL